MARHKRRPGNATGSNPQPIRDMKKHNRKTVNPAELTRVYYLEDHFHEERNTLFVDKSDRLFLAETSNGETILREGGLCVPLEQSSPDEFREVSLVEALNWYVRFNPLSDFAMGNVEVICRLAAESIQRLERSVA
jgi:hypothetical protein